MKGNALFPFTMLLITEKGIIVRLRRARKVFLPFVYTAVMQTSSWTKWNLIFFNIEIRIEKKIFASFCLNSFILCLFAFSWQRLVQLSLYKQILKFIICTVQALILEYKHWVWIRSKGYSSQYMVPFKRVVFICRMHFPVINWQVFIVFSKFRNIALLFPVLKAVLKAVVAIKW